MPPLPTIDVLKLTRSSPKEVEAALAAALQPAGTRAELTEDLAALLLPPEPKEVAADDKAP